MADLGCRVVRVESRLAGAQYLTHNCAAARGTSGAPLLTREAVGWVIVGINIAAGSSVNLALSPPFRD
jgi:protease YdgD